jgi:hypothetical protein
MMKSLPLRNGAGMNSDNRQNGQTVKDESTEERRKKEHEWRQILQQQFAELWLRLNAPKKEEIKLEKIRGSGGKAA